MQQEISSSPFQEEEERFQQGGFSLPALQITNKHYSLEADIATGWQPKMKVAGPVPLNFDASICDEVVETLTSFSNRHQEKVIYLGPRYASSFKLHQQMKRDYEYKYQAMINTNFPHLAAFFRKFYGHFKPKYNRPFKGTNPTLPPGENLIFEGNFESSNLDAAIRIGPNQYDLFMRVDSNTRGHLQWYNFKMRGAQAGAKIRLNIVNFRRSKTLYSVNLRPYIWSSIKRGIWKQGGTKVKYEQKPLRYSFLKNMFSEERLLFNCLSFEYEFQNEEEIVQVAYCPPFTYSDNVKMIQSLITSAALIQGPPILKEQVVGETLGGLEMSLLTITDPTVPDAFKSCIVVSARIHPGQTCGSYMVKGFLQFLCSGDPAAEQLRRQVVFKVIPMMNPDGVVAGNFRTSLCGRDLNRMFKSDETYLIPEVVALKSLVAQLRGEFKSRLLFFLDYHGHSVRKNVFLYGPEYEIWQHNYYRTKILPKIISEKTEMFRYYSCIFRISQEKRTTARAVLMKQVPHCYTIEASVGSYYNQTQKADYDFTPCSWQSMGKIVVQSLKDYFQLMDESTSRKTKEKEKVQKNQSCLPKVKLNVSRTKKKIPHSKSQMQNNRKTNPEHLKKSRQEQQVFNMDDEEPFNEKVKDIIDSIKESDKDMRMNHEEYSEGGSDSEPSEDDLPEKELQALHHQIIVSIKQFKERFYNRGEAGKVKSFLQSSVHIPPKKLEMIASLRKKAEDANNTKQEISSQRIFNSSGVSKSWARGRSVRKSSGHQVAQSQSFQVYVTKLKAAKQEQKYRISYFSPRKKMALR